MKKFALSVALATALAIAAPITSQAQLPGAADAAQVQAGRYVVDTYHTQVVWTVNHLGISPLTGAIAASEGSLQLDPAKPSAAKVTVTFRLADMSTTAPAFTQHLLSADAYRGLFFRHFIAALPSRGDSQ